MIVKGEVEGKIVEIEVPDDSDIAESLRSVALKGVSIGICAEPKRFERDAFAGLRAANVACEQQAGHKGAHSATRGSMAYCWGGKSETQDPGVS